MKDFSKKFGDRLKYILDDKKITINSLSKKIDINEEVIEGYIKNINLPSYERLRLIAKELNVSIDFLLGNSHDYKNVKKIYIGNILKEVLKFKEMSIDYIVKNTSIHEYELVAILNDEVTPSLDALIQLSKVIGVSCDYLLGVTRDILDNEIVLNFNGENMIFTTEKIQEVLNAIDFLNWRAFGKK